MSEVKGIIFDIKRFAVHDGPGIRTTIFMKGCPLKCKWCHNPEGLSPSKEIFYYEYKCMGFGKCIEVCPNDVNIAIEKGISISRNRCSLCTKCIDACPTGARQLVGRELTVNEIIEEINKDIIYYDASGGGVTFSGGEPLMQSAFMKQVLKILKKDGIHTAVDTSGYTSPRTLDSILNNTDLYLYDLKLLNEKEHLKYTGVSNKSIKKNLKIILNSEKDIILRFSIIPGITDNKENINELINFISPMKRIHEIDLLPFHNVYEKYKRLGKKYMMKHISSPSQKKIQSIKETLEKIGLYVKIGG
jgi:pyruvate formate lyase activating enzyme